MIYNISPSAVTLTSGNDIYFFYDDDILYVENCDKDVIDAVNKIKQGCTMDELTKLLGKKESLELLKSLKDINLLRINYKNDFSESIVEKQVYFWESIFQSPNDIQKLIQTKRVCI